MFQVAQSLLKKCSPYIWNLACPSDSLLAWFWIFIICSQSLIFTRLLYSAFWDWFVWGFFNQWLLIVERQGKLVMAEHTHTHLEFILVWIKWVVVVFQFPTTSLPSAFLFLCQQSRWQGRWIPHCSLELQIWVHKGLEALGVLQLFFFKGSGPWENLERKTTVSIALHVRVLHGLRCALLGLLPYHLCCRCICSCGCYWQCRR